MRAVSTYVVPAGEWHGSRGEGVADQRALDQVLERPTSHFWQPPPVPTPITVLSLPTSTPTHPATHHTPV